MVQIKWKRECYEHVPFGDIPVGDVFESPRCLEQPFMKIPENVNEGGSPVNAIRLHGEGSGRLYCIANLTKVRWLDGTFEVWDREAD